MNSIKYPLKVNEFGFYVLVKINNIQEMKIVEKMLREDVLTIYYESPAGHSVTLFDDVFELKKYIKEYPEMLKAESR